MKTICSTIVATVLLFTAFATHAQTVPSDNFILHDADGKITAQLTTSSDGTPALFMYDKNGVVRVSIGLYPDGAPGVVLNDDKGLAGAIMRLVTTNGEPVVVLKENGQDKYVIRKNGPDAPPSAFPTTFLASMLLLSVAISSVVSVSVVNMVNRKKNSKIPQ